MVDSDVKGENQETIIAFKRSIRLPKKRGKPDFCYESPLLWQKNKLHELKLSLFIECVHSHL